MADPRSAPIVEKCVECMPGEVMSGVNDDDDDDTDHIGEGEE